MHSLLHCRRFTQRLCAVLPPVGCEAPLGQTEMQACVAERFHRCLGVLLEIARTTAGQSTGITFFVMHQCTRHHTSVLL
eukprot:1030008-Amphidinium_carterae.1